MQRNKTKRALAFLALNPGLSVYQVAKQFGITPTTLYTGRNRERVRGELVTCPCCDSRVEKLLVPQQAVDWLKEVREKTKCQ